MSKYVNPTGEGYLGVSMVSAGNSVSYGVGMWPVPWDGNTEVYAVDEPPGIALFESDRRPEAFITTYRVSKPKGSVGPSLAVAGAALAVLEVDHGDDVRAYERDAGGVLLVPSDRDPFLEADDA